MMRAVSTRHLELHAREFTGPSPDPLFLLHRHLHAGIFTRAAALDTQQHVRIRRHDIYT